VGKLLGDVGFCVGYKEGRVGFWEGVDVGLGAFL